MDLIDKVSGILENSIFYVTFLIGSIGLGYVEPWLTFAYITFCFLMHGLVLRYFICTNCYYYGDSCHLGWSRIASQLFDKGSEARFGDRMRKIGLPVWGVTWGWPVVGMSSDLLRSFSLELAGFLTGFIVLVIGSLIAIGIGGCSSCKMSRSCPIGSACPWSRG